MFLVFVVSQKTKLHILFDEKHLKGAIYVLTPGDFDLIFEKDKF